MNCRCVIGLVSLATLVLSSGCGKTTGPQRKAGDQGAVEQLVEETMARWQYVTPEEKEKWESLFAQGALPSEAERKNFMSKTIRPDNVQIDGDTATIDVSVIVYNKKTYEDDVTPVKWEAKKEGDTWKLTKTPLK